MHWNGYAKEDFGHRIRSSSEKEKLWEGSDQEGGSSEEGGEKHTHWSFIHSLIHAFIIIHLFIHSFILSFVHSVSQSVIQSRVIESVIQSFIHPFIHALIHAFTHSLNPSFVHSFISFVNICSVIHSLLHSFTSSIFGSEEHSLILWFHSCHLLPCHANGISTISRSFIDASQPPIQHCILQSDDVPRGHWFLLAAALFSNFGPGAAGPAEKSFSRAYMFEHNFQDISDMFWGPLAQIQGMLQRHRAHAKGLLSVRTSAATSKFHPATLLWEQVERCQELLEHEFWYSANTGVCPKQPPWSKEAAWQVPNQCDTTSQPEHVWDSRVHKERHSRG